MLILLIILSLQVRGQDLFFYGEIGTFQSAASLSINQAGFIFICDSGSNEIIKMDTLGNTKRIIGGYGWSASAFDYPADVFANMLNVYVADKNNDRVQIFDKDLNYLSEISSKKVLNDKLVFRYPLSVSVNSHGDLYILDSDNTRILGFSFNGEFKNEIGGYQSGSYTLNNPKDFAVNSTNQLLVLDGQTLVTFDQFGNLVNKINLPNNYLAVNYSSNTLLLIGEKNISYLYDSLTPVIRTFSGLPDGKIIDAALLNKKLYLLTEKKLFVYQIID